MVVLAPNLTIVKILALGIGTSHPHRVPGKPRSRARVARASRRRASKVSHCIQIRPLALIYQFQSERIYRVSTYLKYRVGIPMFFQPSKKPFFLTTFGILHVPIFNEHPVMTLSQLYFRKK
ncbi:hypothetical protein EVAR_58015_1 [Eumeta japonica]|uniref:Uncharacterized protein n=1 Tax=Eumeta variegata TaxID=151549 RepID=A0A4C1YC52_EUMVA|nr:hypothetical protein EVAR_58015_1 [Eumeta japonica]